MQHVSYVLALALLVLLAGCRARGIGTSPDSGSNNTASKCDVGSCEGCCDANGNCLSGTDDSACGAGSSQCANCETLGGACRQGSCIDVEQCSSENCQGCCTEDGNCLSGATNVACGLNGGICSPCGSGECIDGSCCFDEDGDGYGEGCPLGDDCDDLAPGIIEACQTNGCPKNWVFIPAGSFIAGCGDSHQSCGIFELPLQEIVLDGYCIEKTEVSVEAWRACFGDGVCGTPSNPEIRLPSCNWAEDTASDRLDYPMNCISLPNVYTYCREWYGGTLPSEFQWEKAARGVDGRIYPWGDEPSAFDCGRCNYNRCLGEDQDTFTWPVGYVDGPLGDSPFGLKDMCGNVAELTRSCLDEVGSECETSGWVVVKGGFAYTDGTDPSSYTTYYRDTVQANTFPGWSGWGFRCVRNPWEGQPSP